MVVINGRDKASSGVPTVSAILLLVFTHSGTQFDAVGPERTKYRMNKVTHLDHPFVPSMSLLCNPLFRHPMHPWKPILWTPPSLQMEHYPSYIRGLCSLCCALTPFLYHPPFCFNLYIFF